MQLDRYHCLSFNVLDCEMERISNAKQFRLIKTDLFIILICKFVFSLYFFVVVVAFSFHKIKSPCANFETALNLISLEFLENGKKKELVQISKRQLTCFELRKVVALFFANIIIKKQYNASKHLVLSSQEESKKANFFLIII